ncbi:MAG: hypothetical protein SFU53_10640 [Terrimicrobiaceae bacterium]|nr:hypothetical protein [Terrimicrobiaceae bacterium]
MGSQLTFQAWATPVAIIAFVVSVGVFLFFVIGAIRAPKSKVDHDANLPLKKENRK